MRVRLAFRVEGNFWNCYLALDDTMKGAHLIGSITMGAVKQDDGIKSAFMQVMKQVMALTIGRSPEWDERPAPESERSGHA